MTTVLGYYLGLIRSALWTSANTVSRALFFGGLVFTVVGLFNIEIAQAFGLTWNGIPRVWVLPPVLVLALYRVLAENYRVVQGLRELTTASRPKPMLVCREDFRGIKLDVSNEGASALFWCEVRFMSISRGWGTSGIQPSPNDRFRPTWESGQRQATISPGGYESLYLAVTDRTHRNVGFPYTGEPAFSIAWRDFSIESGDVYMVAGDGTRTTVPVSQVVLEVTVFTDPAVNGQIVKRRYVIDAFGHCKDLEIE